MPATDPLELLDAPDWNERVAFVTYGVQLRAYFSRMWPEVLGPSVLGVRPCRMPSLWAPDPWRKQVVEDQAAEPKPVRQLYARTLRGLLTPDETRKVRYPMPAWVNLWRRTDYLGMPAFSYASRAADPPPDATPDTVNVIDVGASESVLSSYQWRVATHSNYLLNEQFLRAIKEALRRLEPHPVTKPPASTGDRQVDPPLTHPPGTGDSPGSVEGPQIIE